MGRARAALDWEKQYSLALDPERARGAVRVTISVEADGTRLVLVQERAA